MRSASGVRYRSLEAARPSARPFKLRLKGARVGDIPRARREGACDVSLLPGSIALFVLDARCYSWHEEGQMEERILDLLRRPGYTPLTAVELLVQMELPRGSQGELERALSRLERSGQVARVKRGDRFVLPLDADLVPGRIRINRQGVGFLQPDDPKMPAMRISQDATATAMHGDRILARRDVLPGSRATEVGREATGRVVRILERARTQLVGTLQRSRQFLFVIPDDPRIPHDIYVPPPGDVGRAAQVGDKVVVELREWRSRHVSPEGEVIEVLGPPDADGVDMLSIIRQYKLALHFPKRCPARGQINWRHGAAG